MGMFDTVYVSGDVQRFMGELPHQWLAMPARCTSGEFVERHVNRSAF